MSELISYLLHETDAFREDRLPSLYSDFQLQKRSNPEGFAANCAAWIDGLSGAAKAGKLPSADDSFHTMTFGVDERLLSALQSENWGRPLAMGSVVSEAMKQRKFIPLEEFLKDSWNIENHKWIPSPGDIIAWALSSTGLFDGDSIMASQSYPRLVILKNTEDASNSILSHMRSGARRSDRTYHIDDFKKKAATLIGAGKDINGDDLKVILKHLDRNKKAVKYNEKVVVFASNDEIGEISQEDETVASLKHLLSKIQDQIDATSLLMKQASERAHRAVAEGDRNLALRSLRTQKTLSRRLEDLDKRSEILEGIFNSIQQAADQIKTIRLIRQSSDVLSDLNKQANDLGSLETTMETLASVEEESAEVGEAIASTMVEKDSESQDLEAEIDNLLQETHSQSSLNHGDQRQEWPRVPPTSPVQAESEAATDPISHEFANLVA